MITRPTQRYCIVDPRMDFNATLTRMAADIQRVLPKGFTVEWVNKVNVDTNDPSYNPDGTWGKFVVSTPEPEFDDV